jgi:DNA-binding response OmpR family regulator
MKSRVLVVDDDPALAEMLTIVLRGEGFDTAVVGDGTRALPAVRDLRPDVVLLDLMLPGMNGIDVCRAIRTESGVPIVMLTAKTDTVDIVLGLESGADEYVVKPFKPKELVARIRARAADGCQRKRSRSATSPSTTRCAQRRSQRRPQFDLRWRWLTRGCSPARCCSKVWGHRRHRHAW